jgi:hypothetical protein
MWALFVADCDPVVGNLVNLIKFFKQISIQDFVPVGFVELFNKSVLDRFSWLDVGCIAVQCLLLRLIEPMSLTVALGRYLDICLVANPYVSPSCSSVRMTHPVDRLVSISMVKTSRLDSSIMFRVLNGLL